MRRDRCPDCDSDGEIPNPDGRGYIRCPRCHGTKRVEVPPMNEQDMYRWLMISAAVLAVLCGLGAVGLVILCAVSFSAGVLTCALLMAAGAVGCGYFTVYFSQKTATPKVFNNQDEREVLNNKQRKVLKRARGDVVMQRAMIEVEQERENIVHRAIEAAHDEDRPPHDTRWTDAMRERVRMISDGRNDKDGNR